MICVVCSDKCHCYSNSFKFSMNKKRLKDAASKGNPEVSATIPTIRATAIIDHQVAKENSISKTNFIQVGTRHFDYNSVVDDTSEDFNPVTIIFTSFQIKNFS